MSVRTITVILFMAFVMGGCTSEKFQMQGSQRRVYRLEQIQNRHPEWDELTVRKVASGRVEIGMTREMVWEALGKADKISQQGNEEIWGYEIIVDNYTHTERQIAYSVFFKNSRVVKTTGDRSRLSYAQ